MTASRTKKSTVGEGVLDAVIGYRLAKARVVTNELFLRHIGGPFNVRPVEYSLLMLLAANDGLTPKQLSRALALPAPNLTVLLDRMQSRALIDRLRSPVDRRSQQVRLTPAGARFASDLAAGTPAMEAELQGSLSAGERAMLLELLDKLARHRAATVDGEGEGTGEGRGEGQAGQ